MKALAYTTPHTLDQFSIREVELPKPTPGAHDLLVEIRAIAINPVDTKVRRNRAGTEDAPVILGWDAAGIVRAVGSEVNDFREGDEVYYAGTLNRAGSYAQYQLVDVRLAAHKPKTLDFIDAAALPLTALTAYEMLFDQFKLSRSEPFDLLVIGGAGGVGSIAIQLIKTLTQGRVYSTSGRTESNAWLQSLGVDGIIDRSKPLLDGLKTLGLASVDHIFSTTHTAEYLAQIPDLLRPYGDLGLIDDPAELNIVHFKPKALSVHWEFMFAKSIHDFHAASQGQTLKEVATLVDTGKIRTTKGTVLHGLTVANMREAHTLQESGKAIGKIVIEL